MAYRPTISMIDHGGEITVLIYTEAGRRQSQLTVHHNGYEWEAAWYCDKIDEDILFTSPKYENMKAKARRFLNKRMADGTI